MYEAKAANKNCVRFAADLAQKEPRKTRRSQLWKTTDYTDVRVQSARVRVICGLTRVYFPVYAVVLRVYLSSLMFEERVVGLLLTAFTADPTRSSILTTTGSE